MIPSVGRARFQEQEHALFMPKAAAADVEDVCNSNKEVDADVECPCFGVEALANAKEDIEPQRRI